MSPAYPVFHSVESVRLHQLFIFYVQIVKKLWLQSLLSQSIVLDSGSVIKLNNLKKYFLIFLQGAAIRGVIAAICCAVLFTVIGLVYKLRWKPPRKPGETLADFLLLFSCP